MVGSGVRLVFTAPGGPVECQVDRLIVFVDEVEQASDLADGKADQAAGPTGGSRVGVLWWWILVWVVCSVRSFGLSTGGGPLFWICVS